VPGKHLLGADMLSRATKSKEKVALTEADIQGSEISHYSTISHYFFCNLLLLTILEI
jgi:hypothetical protein